jgi:hypothetical protein
MCEGLCYCMKPENCYLQKEFRTGVIFLHIFFDEWDRVRTWEAPSIVNDIKEVLGRTNRLLSLIDTGHIENDASNNSSIFACVFVTAVTFLPSCSLATIGGYTYRHTD